MARLSPDAADGRLVDILRNRRALVSTLLLVLLVLGVGWTADPRATGDSDPDGGLVHIDSAVLQLPQGGRAVDLPHAVPGGFIPPGDGTLLRYTLMVDLPRAPGAPLGIYIPKLSLAGALSVNGVAIGSCRPGPLERLRCLHQPQLFVPPAALWQPGLNRIDVDLYVTERQANGLSQVVVGPADTLYRGPYLVQRLLQVNLVHGLTWVVLSLGLLALTVSLILRHEWLYLWFGLCAVFNALSNLNVLVTYPLVDPDVYSWFVFSSRMVTAPLLVLLLLEFHEKAGPWWRRLLLAYALAMPLITWLSGNDRWIVLAAYLPVSAIAFLVGIAMLRWTWQTRQPAQFLILIATWVLLAVSIEDLLRLGGRSRFEGVYLVTYALTGVFLIFGILLISRLASALSIERQLTLRTRLASRAAAAAFWEWDRETGALIWATDPPEPVGRGDGTRGAAGAGLQRWLDAVHPDDRVQVEQRLRQVTPDTTSLSLTCRLRHPETGVESWWQSHALAEPPERGRQPRFAGISINITERKQAELDLKRLIHEREELMQEIHDGFGAELATARTRLVHSQLSQAQMEILLGECLDDLRLVVDTLDNLNRDLLVALANYRYRLQTRLGDAPFTLSWVLPAEDVSGLGSRTILQIMRILQEALNNAIRHAAPTAIRVEIRVRPGSQLTLTVQDDGCGFDNGSASGRGLPSMRARARAIGARLGIRSTRSGTTLELTVPIQDG